MSRDERSQAVLPSETLLALVQRHVRAGKDIVQRQRDLMEHLESTRSPQAREARALLTEFELYQGVHEKHLADIEAEMRAGQRDAEGRLLSLQRAHGRD